MQFVPDWFVTREQINLWDDEKCFNWYDDGKWYDGYKARNAQKPSIKQELMPITWHPLRWWDWCVPEDKKKGYRKIVGINTGLWV